MDNVGITNMVLGICVGKSPIFEYNSPNHVAARDKKVKAGAAKLSSQFGGKRKKPQAGLTRACGLRY